MKPFVSYRFLMFLSLFWKATCFWAVASPCHAEGIKIFWVDSYNAGYEWSDGIEQGIREGLQNEPFEFSMFHMDTKGCRDPECMQAAGLKAKAAIDAFEPDVLVASDDNAQKYLVVPYYKNGRMPVVFCGVNWDASIYGYPASNITGMIEVELVEETVAHMRRYAAGDRIGSISGDTVSDRKIIAWLNQNFFDMQMTAVRVNTFSEFKQRFVDLQKEVDMLFIRNYAGIEGWEALEARKFIARHLRVPTASPNGFMAPYVVFTLGKIPEEQGRYAAETALKIAGGARPSDLPVAANRQARLTVNLEMARAADIVLPVSVLKMATVIGREAYDLEGSEQDLTRRDFAGKRICWVDSYHRGYEWSDGIERAIREVLFDTGVDLKVIRMDTKREKNEAAIQSTTMRAKAQLDAFHPDVVIASDDNAQKYLIVPFYKDTNLPVVFCGVNESAGMYGYPAANVTGMVEVNPVKELMALLKPYAKGGRIGYLAGDVATERKLAGIYDKKVFGGQVRLYMVDTRADFERRFLQAQEEVDILYFSNYTGIADWNVWDAEQFVCRNTRIPSCSNNSFMDRFVACVLDKSSEEQGRYAALTALKVLSGQSPADIPLAINKENRLTVNLQLAEKAGIVFPVSVLKQARVIGRKALE